MAPKYSVGQLLVLDDPALVQHIKDNRDARAMFDVSNIRDWDEVPEAQQTKLLERLMSLGPQAKAPQPLDFGHLFARLNSLRPERETSQQPVSSSPQLARPPSLSPQPDAGKEYQIRSYHELINDGGRPPCSLETLDGIYESPADHIEMLRPWLGNLTSPLNPDDLGVFSHPLERWKDFRRWQGDNRGVSTTDDEDLAAFRDENRRHFESTGLGQLATAPYFKETVEKMWQNEKRDRQWKRDTFREVRNGSFDEYVEAARRRLRCHGFSEDFQLLEDPKQQSERVTWIEYLGFEYWWLDRYTSSVQNRQKQHDAAWEELAQSGVLRDGETEEDLLRSTAQRQCGIDPEPPHVPRRRGPQSASRDKLIDQFIRKAAAVRNTKADKSRQLLRVQWTLDQMPGKEPEAPLAKPARKTRKRSREDGQVAGEPADQPTAKKRKRQEEEDKESAAWRKATPRNKRVTAGLECPVRDTRAPNKEGHRRSARIDKLQAATPEPLGTSKRRGR